MSGSIVMTRVATFHTSSAKLIFFAAYIIPEDLWFIVPLPHILGQLSLLFQPAGGGRRCVYDSYREAWHLLYEPDGIEFA